MMLPEAGEDATAIWSGYAPTGINSDMRRITITVSDSFRFTV
jgi:hypothetical protein